MGLHLKVIAAALAALVISTMPTPASANQQQHQQQRVGLLPFLAGPGAAAAAVGTTTTNFSWFTQHLVTKKVFIGYKKIYVYGKWKYVPKFKTVRYKKTIKHTKSGKSRSAQGKAIVGCIMGSALGAITASMRKMTAMGNPPRWRSQAEHEKIVASGYEKQFELTNDEAMTAIAFCGLGSFALHWEQAPVVQAKY